MTRKALCTLATGPHLELLDIARPRLERYAERHGYELIVGTEADMTSGRPASWSKIPFLREQLRRYELVVWIDADVLVIDDERDIAAELEPGRFLALANHQYYGAWHLNCGVMVLRACDELFELLDLVWAAEELIDHPWWEQAALLRALGWTVDPHPTSRLVRPTRWLAGVQVLSDAWNSLLPDPAPRPRFIHYAAMDHESRLRAMRAEVADRDRRERQGRDGSAPAASIVVVPATAEIAWGSFVAIAGLAEQPRYEVVVVDTGIPDLDEVLARLDGALKVVPWHSERLHTAATLAGVVAAEGDIVSIVHGAEHLDPAFLVDRVAALADTGLAAVRDGLDAEPGDLAAFTARRADLLALEDVLAAAPPRTEPAVLAAAFAAAGRTVRPGHWTSDRVAA